MSEPIVYIVDDDHSMRRSLTRLMKSAGYRSTAFASAREFLDSDRQHDGPACVVLDVRMPGLSGLELQTELANNPPGPAIIFITGHGDVPMSVRAMKKGAVDFLLKPFQDKALLQAIALALDRNVRDRAAFAERRQVQARAEMLTPREREVLELVVTGMLNKQIAAQLGTTEKTVKTHRGRVMEKMAVESLAQLVRDAEKIGIPAARPTA
ncbi:MAG: Response regulator protein TmoT [Verrucomicrobiae bacterium]|nr:Response regulator protein TmoT [Verrucomicrobiae bacterium]